MSRREVIKATVASIVPWPVSALAQERVRRVGLLIPASADDGENQVWVGAFLQGLQQAGWSIGINLRIDARWGGTDIDLIRKHAGELAALAPDVILAHGNGPVSALRQVTRTIPIVFPVAGDPVGTGLVDSLARPGATPPALLSSNSV
jgi:putative ABC transport system substrate-binding protein